MDTFSDMMKGVTSFKEAQKRWEERLQNEPRAWKAERKQYFELLEEERFEEFALLISEDPILFPAFFIYFWGRGLRWKIGAFKEEITIVSRDTGEVLSHTESPAFKMRQFWRDIIRGEIALPWADTNLYDAMVLDAYGEVDKIDKISEVEKNVLLNISLQEIGIESPAEADFGNFAVGRYEVTQILWAEFAKDFEHTSKKRKYPSQFKGLTRPVEQVNWYDAVAFCNALSRARGLKPCYTFKAEGYDQGYHWDKKANGYRLPTADEWEYAARGGENFTYAGSDDPDSVAWYDENSDEETHPVGQLRMNDYQTFDMSGNVREWVWDAAFVEDDDGERVLRGGSWGNLAMDIRVSIRDWDFASVRSNDLNGFRLVRNL
jgi:formylglycine-generating enzyme